MEPSIFAEFRNIEIEYTRYLNKLKELDKYAEQSNLEKLRSYTVEQLDEIIESKIYGPFWQKLRTDYYEAQCKKVRFSYKLDVEEVKMSKPGKPDLPSGFFNWDFFKNSISTMENEAREKWKKCSAEYSALIKMGPLQTPESRFNEYTAELVKFFLSVIPDAYRPYLGIQLNHFDGFNSIQHIIYAESYNDYKNIAKGYDYNGKSFRPRLSYDESAYGVERYEGWLYQNSYKDSFFKELFFRRGKKAYKWMKAFCSRGPVYNGRLREKEDILNKTISYFYYKKAADDIKAKLVDAKDLYQEYCNYQVKLKNYNKKLSEASGLYDLFETDGLIKGCDKIIRSSRFNKLDDTSFKKIRSDFFKSNSTLRFFNIDIGDIEDIWYLYFKDLSGYLAKRKALAHKVFDYFQGVIKREELSLDEKRKEIKPTDFVSRCYLIAEKDPALLPMKWEGDHYKTPEEIVSAISSAASSRTVVPQLFISKCMWNNQFQIPFTVQWHNEKSASNIRFSYDDSTSPELWMNTLNDLSLSMLLSLPPGKVKFWFVDMNLSGQASFLTMNLPPELYNGGVVSNDSDFRVMVSNLQKHITNISSKCANLISHNKNHGEILTPYQVIILYDFPKSITVQHVKSLMPLIENGYKAGVSFVIMENKNAQAERGVEELTKLPSFNTIEIKGSTRLVEAPLERMAGNDTLNEAFFKYIRETFREASRTKVISQDSQSMLKDPYADASTGLLSIEVGQDGGQTVDFVLNQEDHVHAFVIGKSGSGKSVFLRDIILGAVMKYSPEDLSLYLIDLKVGGVEFNGYQSLLHTKAALLDDSDRQIVLEILRDIRSEIKRRGEIMRSAETAKLQDYNKQHRENRLSQILVVVDECQRLFDESKRDRIQTEITDIVDEIATQGRAFGVHLLLSTQTLRGSMISSKVKENVSDFYLLKGGMADGLERLGEETSQLSTGQVYYVDHRRNRKFQAYFLSGAEKISMIENAVQKASGHRDNGRFVFMGKMIQHFTKDDVTALMQTGRRYPAISAGKAVSLDMSPVSVSLKSDMSENVLVIGSDIGNTSGFAQQLYISLMAEEHANSRRCSFICIDCLDNPELPYFDLSEAVTVFGSKLITARKSGEIIQELVSKVKDGTVEPTVVLILGQERYTQLLVNAELNSNKEVASEPQQNMPSFLQGIPPVGTRSGKNTTYRSELQFLLENGPENGIHFIWQVDRLPNLLGDSGLSKQSVMRMFRHVFLLRSSGESVMRLGLPTEMDPERLAVDPERLRAFYINLLDAQYQLFTPYCLNTKEELNNLF